MTVECLSILGCVRIMGWVCCCASVVKSRSAARHRKLHYTSIENSANEWIFHANLRCFFFAEIKADLRAKCDGGLASAKSLKALLIRLV